ncbi:hypothetical protein CDL15_Pgr023948 [Punica granatum]|uniref:Uncharacterized protein n=1 Tax=Punica granatum TaxID=22663 RepID=A0A218WUF4_PUNGR|nr:hypothetical protein CDL15_Pgr023948 [Punica granatum]
MGTLNPDDALQLFSRYAFENESPSQAFRELSIEVVSATDGVPLALVVIGSLLHKYKDPPAWKDIIKRSKKIPFDAVKNRLRISYDNLKRDQKQIFLDIACFFIDTEKTNPIYMWDACEYCPRWALAVLRSSEKWEGWSELQNAKNLKVLNLKEAENLENTPSFPKGLHELPSRFGGLKKLQYLRLSGCAGIKKLPDSPGELKLLVELDLKGTSIFELPQSIGSLEKSKAAILHSCKVLKQLPDSLWGLKALVRLDISGTAIKELPDSIRCL